MKININNLEDLEKTGVYKILNIVNGKYYIGSTKQKFRIRINHHLQALKNNNHKNSHLQRAWNKYGENSFEFYIVEICNKDIVYQREQWYLDNRDTQLSYNINPNATGFSENPETILKLAKSHKKFIKSAKIYYKSVKSNEITLDEVPIKYHRYIKAWINFKPWNKGKHYNSTNHLKVKHRFTEKSRMRCKNNSERVRELADIIYVYDENLKFIDSFRSAKDLEDLSTYLDLPLHSRFSVKRGKCDLNKLQAVNIVKALKLGKTYKGLYFKNKPLHQGIDDRNEPKSVKNWNVNTEVNTVIKETVSPYSIEVEPEKSE